MDNPLKPASPHIDVAGLHDLSQIPAELAHACEELAADNAKADGVEWERVKAAMKYDIKKWGRENIRGLVEQTILDMDDAADEARQTKAYGAARRII